MPLIKQTLITTKTFFVRLVNCSGGSPSDLYPYAGCFPVKRSVGLTFVYVMIGILIIIHLVEVCALVKLAALKGDLSALFVAVCLDAFLSLLISSHQFCFSGRGLEDMLRKRAMSSTKEPIIEDAS